VSDKFIPETLYEAGYTDLVSVIPPGAQLTPTSKVSPASIGKAPGRRLDNGLWAGYDWRRHEATVADVRRWSVDGASVGLRANRFPGVDIDCTDPQLAQLIEDAALATLGPAPVRIGRAPKRLLMYRTSEPFSRMRLFIKKGKEQHMVEILGEGQQFLVHGVHPVTGQPYRWNRVPKPEALTEIDRDKAEAFLSYLQESIEMIGIGLCEREGDGRRRERTSAGDQSGLVAPSIEALQEAVEMIPNANTLFPDRESYIKMGYAIRAASGADVDDGFHVFAEWAARWDGGTNAPETVLQDWRRMKPPFAVGWSWIAEQARTFGFNDAQLEFEVTEDARIADATPSAPMYSDQWLAEQVVRERRGELRYIPEEGKWLVWSTGYWKPDAELLAEDIVKQELKRIALQVQERGATTKEIKEMGAVAIQICSAGKASAVRTLSQSDRAIAVSVGALDHDPWLLNTPGGIVDLRAGKLMPPTPDALCTKSTSVPPDFGGNCPEWKRFLDEATGGDKELQAYMQRLSGYCLTGSTREQQLTFIYGKGENGKSTFQHALEGVLKDYWKNAPMDTFTASYSEKHSTDLAGLKGARLVTAAETEAGKRWDEAKIKTLTGGDPVTARFMRQDNFTYKPQFKLVFIGNHKPELRNVDKAMRRRIQMVPFLIAPKVKDPDLGDKLRKEYPAILAWMVEGCLEWQRAGLAAPQAVLDMTEEYFEGEDAVGRFLKSETEPDAEGCVGSTDLFSAWREWAGANGEFVGTAKRLSTEMIGRGYQQCRVNPTRRNGFSGLKLINRQDLGVV
jgi:putative DNA primase/helicase